MKHKLSLNEKYLLERNISLNYIVGALMWGRFFIPVLALFYIASQVPLEQFAIIMSVFAFTTLILEIPTGVFADLLGKKKTLLLSRFMYIIEIFILAFFNGFWPFLIAKIISGIGVSLSSGTSSSFLFDTLQRLKRTKEHKIISGKLSSISSISMAFVFIIGAYLFTIHPKLPAYASLPLIVLGFLLTFLYREPYKPHQSLTFSHAYAHLREGLAQFRKRTSLQYLALLSLGVSSMISISLSLSSAYFENILIPLGIIGVISFCGNLLNAYSSKKAHLSESFLGEKNSLMLVQVVVVLSSLLMGLLIPYFGILLYFVIMFMQGFFGVLSGDYAHRHAHTSHRATLLSIVHMFDNIGIFVLFLGVGYLTKIFSLGTAFLSLGGFLIIYFLLVYLMYARRMGPR